MSDWDGEETYAEEQRRKKEEADEYSLSAITEIKRLLANTEMKKKMKMKMIS